MKRTITIFLAIIGLSLGSFIILWATNPVTEKEQTQATHGIRMLGSTVIYTGPESNKTTLKVGDLILGSNEQVFRVIEIRKSQSGSIYVVVSWKFIMDYPTYQDFMAEPYGSYKTFEVVSFMYGKTIISDNDLKKFYVNYSSQVEEQIAIRNKTQSTDIPSVSELAAQPPVPPTTSRPPEKIEDISAYDQYQREVEHQQQLQAAKAVPFRRLDDQRLQVIALPEVSSDNDEEAYQPQENIDQVD